MSSPITERLRDAVAKAHWNVAVALLQTSDALPAAVRANSFSFIPARH
jgi:hypothetical protein